MKARASEKEEYILSLYDRYYADLKRLLFHYVSHDRQFLPEIEECIQDTMTAAFDAHDLLVCHGPRQPLCDGMNDVTQASP